MQDGEEQILKSILSFLSDTFEITLVEPEQSVKVDFPGLTIFPFERKVMVEGEEVSFTLHEFDLLLFLSSHPQQVLQIAIFRGQQGRISRPDRAILNGQF